MRGPGSTVVMFYVLLKWKVSTWNASVSWLWVVDDAFTSIWVVESWPIRVQQNTVITETQTWRERVQTANVRWVFQRRLIAVDSSVRTRRHGLVGTQMVGLIYCLLSSCIVLNTGLTVCVRFLLLLSVNTADSCLVSKHSLTKSLRYDIKRPQPIRFQHSALKTTVSYKYWRIICSSDAVSLA